MLPRRGNIHVALTEFMDLTSTRHQLIILIYDDWDENERSFRRQKWTFHPRIGFRKGFFSTVLPFRFRSDRSLRLEEIMRISAHAIRFQVVFAGIFALALTALFAPSSAQDDRTRIIPLPEIMKNPSQVRVENGRVYIIDEHDLIVCDFSTGRLLRRIGKHGQGPGEFMYVPRSVTVFPDRLVVGDMQKVLFFSPEGEYLGQMMEPGRMRYPFLPIGDNFVGFASQYLNDGSSTAVGCIYNSNGRLIKTFYGEMPVLPPPPRREGPRAVRRNVLTIRDYADYLVYENRIYVADSRKGLFISVFNEHGDPLYEISHKIPTIRVPKSFRDPTGRFYDDVTRSVFPAFVNFRIDAGRIYVITPDQKDGLYEVIVMDLKGRILDQAYRFPLRPNFSVPHVFGSLYDIEDDKFVWYAYNEAKEIYELHVR